MRVMVNGAFGKMGQLACKVVENCGYELVARLGRADDFAESIRRFFPEVVIDFTSATSAFQNTQIILENGARPIIGTSGLNEKQVDTLALIAKGHALGGIVAPNLSIGAMLMMRFSKEAARYFSQVDIIETHHRQKKDAPSGTAIRTAEIINAVQKDQGSSGVSIETIPHALGAKIGHVTLHSLRNDATLAKQEVIFASLGESLTIEHNTLNREAFIPGIQLALLKILTVDHLVYGLDKLL